jgi:ribosome-binding protein aMBF1 (putative translation factor)
LPKFRKDFRELPAANLVLLVEGDEDLQKTDKLSASKLKTDLGDAIKHQRSALGISQDELARRSGLHRTYLSDLERGTRNPSVGSIQKIAIALHVHVSKLFETEENGEA